VTRIPTLGSAVLAALLTCAGPLEAQVLTLRLTDTAGNVPAGNAVTVAPGGSFTYRAYLQADAAAQSQITTHGGLTSAVMRVTQGNPALVTATTPTANTALWALGNTNGSTTAIPVINAVSFTGVQPSAFGTAGAIGVLLGTISFTAGNTPGSNLLTIQLRNGAPGDVGTADNTNLGQFTQSSTTTFTIAAVPEPGALALAGLTAAGLAVVRCRRARVPATAARA
jgi:PEP-CTERM motif